MAKIIMIRHFCVTIHTKRYEPCANFTFVAPLDSLIFHILKTSMKLCSLTKLMVSNDLPASAITSHITFSQ